MKIISKQKSKKLSRVILRSNQIFIISDKIIELSVLNKLNTFDITNNKIISMEKRIINEFRCSNFLFDKNIILT